MVKEKENLKANPEENTKVTPEENTKVTPIKKVIPKKTRMSETEFANHFADLKDLTEVFTLVKKIANANFDEAVECAIRVISKKKKTDKIIRGSLSFPHSVVKTKPKIAVFASGEDVEKAKNAGAAFAGLDDLITEIMAGKVQYDYYVATKSVVGQIAKVARILKGSMPNLKLGTVTEDVSATCKRLLDGIVQYREDKASIIHVKIGYRSFTEKELKENFTELLRHLYSNYNNGRSINEFLCSVYISSTMSRSIGVSYSILNSVIKNI